MAKATKKPSVVRIGVSQPPDWWKAWREAAEKEGKSLAEWVGDCCNARLTPAVLKTMSARVKAGGYRRNGKRKKIPKK